jgi:hypothetical protein
MDDKTQVSATATPSVDAAATEVDTGPVAVSTSAVPEKVTASAAVSNDKEWKITIQNRDGTNSEVTLSPVSPENPTRQEIRIVMPGEKTKAEVEDPEAEKNPNTKDVRRIPKQHARPSSQLLTSRCNRLPTTPAKCEST